MKYSIPGITAGTLITLLWFMPYVSTELKGFDNQVFYKSGYDLGGVLYLICFASITHIYFSVQAHKVLRILTALVIVGLSTMLVIGAGDASTLGVYFTILLSSLTLGDAVFSKDKAAIEKESLKKCTYCAEKIQKAARVCKHCQRDLPV